MTGLICLIRVFEKIPFKTYCVQCRLLWSVVIFCLVRRSKISFSQKTLFVCIALPFQPYLIDEIKNKNSKGEDQEFKIALDLRKWIFFKNYEVEVELLIIFQLFGPYLSRKIAGWLIVDSWMPPINIFNRSHLYLLNFWSSQKQLYPVITQFFKLSIDHFWWMPKNQ